MSTARRFGLLFKCAGQEFIEDRAITYGAAVAFFTALSLAPLVVILLAAVGWMGIGEEQLVGQVRDLLGPRAAEGVRLVVENAGEEAGDGPVAGLIGLGTLLLGATGVFAQLQVGLNAVWDVKPKRTGVSAWLRKRLVSLGLIATIGFLLLVSLGVSTALRIVLDKAGLPWVTLETALSLLVYVLLFAAVFKILPDATIAWRDVWMGATLTAVLFALGKVAIGQYLGYSALGSAYGAAGTLIVLLVWVYFSALILFFGAELTQVGARQLGRPIGPEPEIAEDSDDRPPPPEPLE